MNKEQAFNEAFKPLFTMVANNTKQLRDRIKKLEKEAGIKIVYLAGKVTGLPYFEVYAKFKKRELELIEAGYVVINPCDYVDKDEDWESAMIICFALIPLGSLIELLHDWQDSKGATEEKHLADLLKIMKL